MATTLQKELDTYQRHKEKLLGDAAEGRFVLIKSDEIAGIFLSELDAIQQGYERFGPVGFLVMKVERDQVPLTFTAPIIE